MAIYRSHRSEDAATAALGVAIILFWGAIVVGWIWNIVKIAGSVNEPITAMFIFRCIGVFLAPVGGVLGFL